MPKASSLKEYTIEDFIKETIEKESVKALVIGEEHFTTGDTRQIMQILESLRQLRNLTFFAEYMPSNQPDGFDTDNTNLDRFIVRKVEHIYDREPLSPIPRSTEYEMTVNYQNWKSMVQPRDIEVKQKIFRELPESYNFIGPLMNIDFSSKDETNSFLDKSRKVFSILNFAYEQKVKVFGIDLPTIPVVDTGSRYCTNRDRERAYRWDDSRDPWMAEQIERFLSAPARATNDLLVCFVGANHIKGLRSGNRNDAKIYYPPKQEKQDAFTGIRNSNVAFLEFVATHTDFELYKASAKYFKYYSPQ